MKEQPPRPRIVDSEVYYADKGVAAEYIRWKEQENTALKERVAKLEKKLELHKPGAWNAPEVK